MIVLDTNVLSELMRATPDPRVLAWVAAREIMKPIPLNPETRGLARRIIWFEPPAAALADPVRFMAYVMAHATPEDLATLRRYVSDDDFREALDKAPAGIIDPRSWAYWNSKMGRYPAPPLPRRHFG